VRSTAGKEWCDVLERFGLNHEQAEILTRVTVERASAWFARMGDVLALDHAGDPLIERPPHPDALRRGLELWRQRNGIVDE
jgi:hypothetical protein